MGIDVHGFNFLRYAKMYGNFKETITIGRQNLNLDVNYITKKLKITGEYIKENYCELLLKEYFGSTSVSSIDNSNFEKATHIYDLNKKIINVENKYDTVFDGGCLEHIYNLPQALENLSLICKPGGQIIHVLPANNFCGHGFWQFSPETFFSVYCDKNGYTDTEVFIADLAQEKKWFKIKKPRDGERVNLYSRTSLYVLVMTKLINEKFSHSNIQQSDYVSLWNGSSKAIKYEDNINTPLKIFRNSFLHVFLAPMARVIKRYILMNGSDILSSNNKNLEVYNIKSIDK